MSSLSLEVKVFLQRDDATLRQRGDLATGRTGERTAVLVRQVLDAACAVRVVAGQEARVCERLQAHEARIHVELSISRHLAECWLSHAP